MNVGYYYYKKQANFDGDSREEKSHFFMRHSRNLLALWTNTGRGNIALATAK